ncbi:hypothetical protein DRE_02829 [Drechslerella stenobrocha 248]|uniref:RING-type domain-containing protein n=1 Tax=Drechslerella stenobrocha 248 TaxID=1043628 RepID=W7I649_9PEZI|nr:hypothetical protein DRE_02829 [Drechslerella stenobrocha 248]
MPDADAPVPRVVLLDECLAALLVLFPDIDPAYIARLYEEHVWDEGVSLVELVVDLVLETNGNYPKAQKGDKSSKRKRERSPSEMTAAELDTKYNHAERPPPRPSYTSLSRKLLRNAFPYVPATVIDAELGKKYFLFPAFKALAQTEANYDKAEVKPYKKLGRMRKNLSEDALAREGENLSQQENESLRSEFRAAVRLYEAMTIQGRIRAGASEVASPDTAQDEALFECGCCFGEVPFLELTQCSDGHLFCFDCGRRNAETEVGQQKYKLLCMDASGCRKEFPPNEIKRFCDEKTVEILERLEQRDVLRLAEIDDLSECPFCDFAAILPPVEFDREFRCHNPECMKVSCRMCDKETHIPLTCEEKAKEENSNLRRDVEEAMTEALLRKCGKCGLPYVKESGCNKITCSRCSAINCYLCSKVIKDYKHFNDSSRGGRAGNCLLFDNTDERHHNEVQAAEQAAINRVRAENPGISEEAMRVKLSRVVLDEERQRIEDGNRRLGINNPPAIAAVAAKTPVLQPQPLIRRLPAGPPQVNLPAPPANFLQALQGIPPGAGPQAPAGPVIYNPVPIPFQPVLAQQLPHNPVPIVPHAQVIGFQDLPPMIQQASMRIYIKSPPK